MTWDFKSTQEAPELTVEQAKAQGDAQGHTTLLEHQDLSLVQHFHSRRTQFLFLIVSGSNILFIR